MLLQVVSVEVEHNLVRQYVRGLTCLISTQFYLFGVSIIILSTQWQLFNSKAKLSVSLKPAAFMLSHRASFPPDRSPDMTDFFIVTKCLM